MHWPATRATMSVPHVGKLVFVREEIKNEHAEKTAELYTAAHLDELEAAGQLQGPHEHAAGGQIQAAAGEIAAAAAGAVVADD